MRILFVTPGFPAPPTTGGSQRNFHLIRLLARHHQIHLFSLAATRPDADALATLQGWCHSITLAPIPVRSFTTRLKEMVTTATPDLARRVSSTEIRSLLARTLQNETFDLVQAEGLEVGADLIEALDAMPAPRPLLVLDAHNAEYLLQQRAFAVDRGRTGLWPAAVYSLVQWIKLRRYERMVCQRAAVVVAVSEQDRQALLALDPALQIVVAPHGVDVERYRPSLSGAGRSNVHPELLFTGTMDFRPNVDAATWFCSEILPRVREHVPNVHLTIAGRSPTAAVRALESSAVTVTGAMPDDLPYFQQATAFVLPMRYGGGVRLKLLQALAVGLAVVSTEMGAEGVPVRDREHLLVARQPEAFAQAVVRVLTDRPLAARLGAAGRALAQQNFSWEAAAETIETAYGALIAKHSEKGLRTED